MRWALFSIFLCTILFNTGVPVFAKSRNVVDNTRNIHIKAEALIPQVIKKVHQIGKAVDLSFGEELICTTDEEDDLCFSVPARKQLQSIVAYFLAAFSGQDDTRPGNSFYRTSIAPVTGFNRSQLCVFRI